MLRRVLPASVIPCRKFAPATRRKLHEFPVNFAGPGMPINVRYQFCDCYFRGDFKDLHYCDNWTLFKGKWTVIHFHPYDWVLDSKEDKELYNQKTKLFNDLNCEIFVPFWKNSEASDF
eukprot:UN27101